jgi:hypothetical protein
MGRLATVYLLLGMLKHVVPFEWLVRWCWRDTDRARNGEAERRAIAVVTRLRSWFGTGDDCLQSSLVLYRELSRLGAAPLLTVAFRRRNDRIEGHAWISVDGRPIPRECDQHLFEPVMRFGRRGALVTTDSTR